MQILLITPLATPLTSDHSKQHGLEQHRDNVCNKSCLAGNSNSPETYLGLS